MLREKPGSPRPGPASGPDRSAITEAAKAWSVALDFVVSTVAGAVIGWLIDRWLGSKPWGTLIGLGVGFVVAFVRIIRYSQRSEREELARRSGRSPDAQDRPPNTP